MNVRRNASGGKRPPRFRPSELATMGPANVADPNLDQEAQVLMQRTVPLWATPSGMSSSQTGVCGTARGLVRLCPDALGGGRTCAAQPGCAGGSAMPLCGLLSAFSSVAG